MNDAGVVVGNSQRISGLAAIATMWAEGQPWTECSGLSSSGWTLRSAEGINAGGDIVGFGSLVALAERFSWSRRLLPLMVIPFSNTATVTITVNGTPDAPNAENDSFVVLPDNSVHGNVLFNDQEPDGDQ